MTKTFSRISSNRMLLIKGSLSSSYPNSAEIQPQKGQKETINKLKDKLPEVNEAVWMQEFHIQDFCFYMDFESITYLEVKKRTEYVKHISFSSPFHGIPHRFGLERTLKLI